MDNIEITQENNITIVKQENIEIRYTNYTTEFEAFDFTNQLTKYKLDIIVDEEKNYKAFGSLDDVRMFSLTDELEFRLYDGKNIAIITKDKVKLFEEDEYICSMENEEIEDLYFYDYEQQLREFIEIYLEDK